MAKGAVYALIVLFAINLMNFFDRQIIGGVGEALRREWGLSDTALGALGTAFTLLYAVVGVPLGRLADRTTRKHILAGGVFVWSLLTALSGAARTFGQLFVVRLGVGIGEASCSPAATSLLGDLFPITMRARAMSIFMLGLPIGLGISSWMGGVIAQSWGWRAAFYIAGIPGVVCALAALAIREPPRGMVEEKAIGNQRRAGSPYWLVLTIPTVWWVILSGALHNFNMYALGAFLSPFLIRFHQITIRDAGFVTMFVYGLSGIVGLIGGGMVADALYRRRVDGRLLTGTAAITISAPLMYLSLLRPSGDVWMFSVLMGGGIGIMYAYYSSVYATLQDVVEPSLRGTAMALYFCAMYILGASLGPLGTGVLSDYYTFKAAAAAGVAQERAISELLFDLLPTMIGRSKLGVTPAVEPFRAAGLHSAMYVIPLLASFLAVVLFAASRTVKKDVAKLRAWMAQAEAASVRRQVARVLLIATLAGPAALLSAQTPPAQTPPPQTPPTTTSAQTTTGRASVPMPIQKQTLQYFAGKWTVEWMGPETPLAPGPYNGTVTFAEKDGGKSLDAVTDAKSDAGPYRVTATVTFDPDKKTLTWSERRPDGVAVNGVGDWTSPLAIRFDIQPVTVKGQTFRIRRTLTVISAGSFSILEEYATGTGPFKRLGNGVFAREQSK